MYSITKEKYREISGFIRFCVKSEHDHVKVYYNRFMTYDEYIAACESLKKTIKMFSDKYGITCNQVIDIANLDNTNIATESAVIYYNQTLNISSVSFVNNKSNNDTSIDPSGAMNEIEGVGSGYAANLETAAGGEVTRHFKRTKLSGSAYSVDIDALVSSNHMDAKNTYDAEGNHLNKSSEDIMYKKGFLGSKHSTNQLYYDEYGNIALDAYDRKHTTDSIASRAAKRIRSRAASKTATIPIL